jgi:Ni,Fe-hydrogenase I cytochrome b subunit
MSRRRNKAQKYGLGGLLVIGFVCWLVSKVLDATGIVVSLVILAGVIVGIATIAFAQRQSRLLHLRTKYSDERIVELILARNYWQGQTAEQLRDSLGSPLGIDRKAMATRKREVWKYNRRGSNRFGLRITLDNDVVTNWDHKE